MLTLIPRIVKLHIDTQRLSPTWNRLAGWLFGILFFSLSGLHADAAETFLPNRELSTYLGLCVTPEALDVVGPWLLTASPQNQKPLILFFSLDNLYSAPPAFHDALNLAHQNATIAVVIDAPVSITPSDPAWTVKLQNQLLSLSEQLPDYVAAVRINAKSEQQAPLDLTSRLFGVKIASVSLKARNSKLAMILGDGWLSQVTDLEALAQAEITPYFDGLVIPTQPTAFSELNSWSSKVQIGLVGKILIKREADSAPLPAFFQNASHGITLTEIILPYTEALSTLKLTHRLNGFFTASLTALEPSSEVVLRDERGRELHNASIWRFADGESLDGIVVYQANQPEPKASVELVLDTDDVAHVEVHDLTVSEPQPRPMSYREPRLRKTLIRGLPALDHPLIVRYKRFSALEGTREQFQTTVASDSVPQVAEIIERYQRRQAAQDLRLQNYNAQGMVELRVAINALSLTFNLKIASSYYFDPAHGLEWEQKEFFLDGVRWRSAKMLRMPMLQPENVQAQPLDLMLDNKYAYTYLKTETINERLCYKIRFTPITPAETLFEGDVWIDTTSYAKIRLRTVQTALKPPTLSSVQIENYAEVAEIENLSIWLPVKITGQQLFTTAGRSTVVDKNIEITSYRVNAPDYPLLRAQAHASNHVMMTETKAGLQYLEKKPGGERVAQTHKPDSLMFALTGMIYDAGQEYPLPLLGIDYYDLSIANTGAQINLMFVGVFLTLNLFKPAFLLDNLEVGSDFVLMAYPTTDRMVKDEDLVKDETVSILPLSGNFTVSYALLEYFKVSGMYEARYSAYMRHEDTGGGYQRPEDSTVHTFQLQGEFNRNNWNLQAFGSVNRRDRWSAWGYPESAGDLAVFREYTLWGAKLSKDIYPGSFQKLHLELGYRDGANLDRFSKPQFALLTNYIHGYGMNALKADRTYYAKSSYGLSFLNLVRIEAFVDCASVLDRDVHADWRTHLGFGLGGGLQGPYGLLLRFDGGYGLDAIRANGGKGATVIQLQILKTFH